VSKPKRQSKWIKDVDGDTPLNEAATTILAVRLEPISELLPLAHQQFEEDVEYIHQLRVATRRGDAAMIAFQPCFKGKPWRRVRKMLKRIRRAAGEARICDVHLLMLADRRRDADAESKAALDFAYAHTAQRRLEVQQDVEEAARRYPPARIERRIGKLLRSTRQLTPAEFVAALEQTNGRAGKSVSCNGQVTELTLLNVAQFELPRAMQEVLDAAEEDLTVFENLHQLRIASKKLRYSVELFANCFDARLKSEFYPRMKELQDYLGEINDAHEMAMRFDRYAEEAAGMTDDPRSPKISATLRRLAEREREHREQLRHAFLVWWTDFRRRGVIDQLERFVDDALAPIG
jgi:CHAD domain-containing protein